MDIASYLRSFESSMSSYTGDDPLDPWDKFVGSLEQRLPADGASQAGMSQVFDSLVQTFLSVERYANDVRYVNYCIRCARFYSDPVALYSHVFSKGVGTRTAALYVAWAQQFEQRGLTDQAEAVFQKALENEAQPLDAVLDEHRKFQTRTRSQTPAPGARNPLQTSHLSNQMPAHRETVAPNKPSVEVLSVCPKPAAHNKTAVTVSRSEVSGTIPSGQSVAIQTVPEYLLEDLVCEGSELCFEEVRAARYFRRLQEEQDSKEQDSKEQDSKEQEPKEQEPKEQEPEEQEAPPSSEQLAENVVKEYEVDFMRYMYMLEDLNQDLQVCGGLSRRSSALMPAGGVVSGPGSSLPPPARPLTRVSSRLSLGLRLHREPALVHQQGGAAAPPQTPTVQHSPDPEEPDDVFEPPEPEEKLSMSQGGTGNLSHVTPNTSLGFIQATPSRALPSPTVNTREALDVIMDMFQAPTLLEDPFSNMSVLHGDQVQVQVQAQDGAGSEGGVSNEPPSSSPFTVFQDDADREGASVAAPSALHRPKTTRALAEIPVSNRPNDTPPDLAPDESTMWGARYNSLHSLAACPNSTSDFAMLAHFVSTPSTGKTPFSGALYQDKENNCDGEDEAFIRRQTKKLSPILEQSPSNEKLSETGVSHLVPASHRHGTIVGEGLASAQLCLTSTTMVQPPPPAVLSFRDQTVCPAESSVSRAAAPGWEVYVSPERPPSQDSTRKPFTILEDLDRPASPERVQKPIHDVPMSPECLPRPDWLAMGSPDAPAETDLDAFLSPCGFRKTANQGQDVPMSPAQQTRNQDVPMSPAQQTRGQDVPMSPAQQTRGQDVPMSPAQQTLIHDESMTSPERRPGSVRDPVHLVPDPWSEDLICGLLSGLKNPLSSHPRCFSWQCALPNISPKTTLRMGKASLKVDCVLGQGAFATVFQATDPVTSERMVLKVQKPANAWEFYVHTVLDSRLSPDVRHLFSAVRSAHLFHDGSVLQAELHNYGTLLNAVNMYKTLSDKLMPQPLVLYFTVCVLDTVERLHAARVVHADIKPDNFLLGERFLENRCFDLDSVDHGLVLVDLGQSIDMDLFPEGTAFTAKCLTSGFQCTEMLSGKPWNYQTDYFGIAATVFCLLFGTYMQVSREDGVWRTNGVFRRNPHSDLWQQFFHVLLNVPDCSSLPSLRSLRHQVASVLQQNYSGKLPTLKSRLLVMLLESRKAGRR
ncbi:uncharacterized protein V6R79_019095 [Siganus canaliculatus]